MLTSNFLRCLIIIPVIVFLTACESAPGTRKQQGAVIGGAAGAAVGAAVTKNHLLGALIGGALGAGGGYVIAAKTDKVESNDQAGAAQAARKAQENPATPQDARKAMTADLNMDGFVTLDEVVAVKQAGFTDQEVLRRLQATDQVFELTADQEKYLRDRGFNQSLINQIKQVNLDKAQAIRSSANTRPTPAQPVISQPAPR